MHVSISFVLQVECDEVKVANMTCHSSRSCPRIKNRQPHKSSVYDAFNIEVNFISHMCYEKVLNAESSLSLGELIHIMSVTQQFHRMNGI